MIRFPSFRLLAVILFSLSAQVIAAQIPSSTQPVQITGVLRYADTGQPASDVIVQLEGLSGGYLNEVRTDRLGKFRFQNLLPVQYHVIIRHPGYREIQREVNLIMYYVEYLQLSLVPEISSSTSPPASSKLVLDANVPPQARKEFEKAVAVLAAARREKFQEGIKHLEKAISIYPNFLEAQLKLGAAYMDLQEWDKAEQALRRALEINPKTANAFFALGELYLRKHELNQAEKVLREGLSIEDRSWRGHFNLGRVYWSRNEIVKAGRQVALAIQLNPNFADAHLLGANILLRANKREDALNEFQEYLRLAPNGEYAAEAREAVQKLKQLSQK